MRKFDKKSLEYARKFLEYKSDPIRFAEEMIYIPTPGGDELVKLYDPQKKVLKSFFDDHFLVLLKSRQTGFSTLCQIILTYISTFYDNVIAGVLSRDATESSDFCRKVEDMIDKLPNWIRPTYKAKSVQSFITTNGCQLWSSAISPANPGAVFRGKSITILIIDEAAHIRNIDEAWTGIAMALSKAQMSAERNSVPFGTIVLSTPNRTQGIGQWFFQQWSSSRSQTSSIFIPHTIYWKEIPDFINDPNWYIKQCKILNNDNRKIAQELELKFIASENTLFSEDVQTKLQNIEGQRPLEVIRFGKGNELWRFKNIRKNMFHIISADTASEAGGSDYSAIEVFEYETMDQVLEFKGKMAVKKFSEIVKLTAKLCPHNIIVIENNSYGNQVTEELKFDEEYEYNLFGEVKGKSSKHSTKGKLLSEGQKFIPGLNTNSKSRPLIQDALYNYVSNNPELIKSERLAFELLGLCDKMGKVEADVGHDDLAMAFAFICYVRHYCRDSLGITEATEDGETTFVEDSIAFISGLNRDGTSPPQFYEGQNFTQFKKNLDDFIQENAGTNLTGTVDTFALWRKDNDLLKYYR